MNVWKKIIMILVIGFGVNAVSASEQNKSEKLSRLSFRQLIQLKVFHVKLAQIIEQGVNIVSKVSDLRIQERYMDGILKEPDHYFLTFTVETIEGDIFRLFSCSMDYTPPDEAVIDSAKPMLYLKRCQSSKAVFHEDVVLSVSLEEFFDEFDEKGKKRLK